MAETPSPIEVLRRLIAVGHHSEACPVVNVCTCGWDEAVADAHAALAQVEAVVAALRYYVAEEEGTEGDTEFLQEARAALAPFVAKEGS